MQHCAAHFVLALKADPCPAPLLFISPGASARATLSARPTDLQEQEIEDEATLVLLDQLALVQFLLGNLEAAEKTLQQVLQSSPVSADPQLSAVARLRLGSVLLGGCMLTEYVAYSALLQPMARLLSGNEAMDCVPVLQITHRCPVIYVTHDNQLKIVMWHGRT